MRERRQREVSEEEVLSWQERQISLRKKYSATPPGFVDQEAERREEQNLRLAWEEYEKRSRYRFLSPYEPEEERFVGRAPYLEQIKAAFENHRGPVVLYGMGGIGKTALARAYVRCRQQGEESYDAVLFLSYNTSLEALICDDFQTAIANLYYSRDKYGSKSRYFREKMKVLRDLAEKMRLLLVLDDCNVDKDRRMGEVFSLPCDILVTTRMNPDVWEESVTGICVRELETDAEWEAFIEAYQNHPFTFQEKQELFQYRNRIHGHTLLMMFRIHGLDVESSQTNPEGFAEDLFRRFKLSRDEKQALRELSILPVQGIESDLYHRLSKVSKQAIQSLSDRLLIRREGKRLSLHPIVASSARKVFAPTQKSCLHLLCRLHSLTANSWNHTYLEKQQLEPYVFAVLQAFPEPFPWLYRQYDAMITFLWIQGYFEEAEHYCYLLVKSVERGYGREHQVTGEIDLRMAAVYYNAMDFEKAHQWYVKGFQCMRQCEPFDRRYHYVRSTACAKMSREYRYEGNTEEALALIEEAILQIEKYQAHAKTESEVEDGIITRCFWILHRARILWDLGQREEALQQGKNARQAVWKLVESGRPYQHDLNEFDRFLLKGMEERGEYEQAEALALSLVERAGTFQGKISKDLLSSREHLADVWAASGKREKAQEEYAWILTCLLEEFPYQRQWIQRVTQKSTETSNEKF